MFKNIKSFHDGKSYHSAAWGFILWGRSGDHLLSLNFPYCSCYCAGAFGGIENSALLAWDLEQ
jgi:hypothetical protein